MERLIHTDWLEIMPVRMVVTTGLVTIYCGDNNAEVFLCGKADQWGGYSASWNRGSLPLWLCMSYVAILFPVYKMHIKGLSCFKDKNALGARLVLSV